MEEFLIEERAEMKKIFSVFFLITFTLVLAACTQPAPIAQLPTETPAQAASAVAIQPVTQEMLQNASFPVNEGKQTVQLSNGKYENGEGADYINVALLPQVAFGDLNGDGAGDAVVLIAENYGGSGTFISLVPVLAGADGPVVGQSVLLGDRVQVKSEGIQNGTVQISLLTHGPDDPECCPSVSETRTYEYRPEEGLVLMGVTSQTANGIERKIVIDAPAAGSEVSSPMTLKGSVSVAPFENNLVISLFDAKGTKVASLPLMVNAAEMGGPGTFETQVDLAAAGVPAGQVRVEVADQSPADGSPLALAAVYATYK